MGYALAKAAAYRGAEVKLVSGPTNLEVPLGVELINVETAAEMKDSLLAEFDQSDFTIMAAAVSDYRPQVYTKQKIKKKPGDLSLDLERTTDILSELGKRKKEFQTLVGFAAETENLIENAKKKLVKKNADFIIANDISKPNIAFGSDQNQISILSKSQVEELALSTKADLADKIFDYLLKKLINKN